MQVDQPVTGLEDSNDMATYNIWSHRRQKGFGPPKEGRGTKQKSEYRCHADLDSGWTRGERAGCTYCCLYFARGICHHGSDCNYLHRVPTEADEAHHAKQPQYDIFGRDRIAETGSTKGVGSYNRQCTTLYIYLGGAATQPVQELHDAITKDFREWGPVQDVSVKPSKSIAFVRYAWRASAEFAKAAMHQQTLRGILADHVLDVRWANDDPNPKSQLRVKRDQEEALETAYLDAVSKLDPDAKRARLYELGLVSSYRIGAVVSAYPNTSDQYQAYEYQGWDAKAYADAGVPSILDEVSAWPTKTQEVVVGQEGVEDDINRYLPPSDEEDNSAAYAYEEPAAPARGAEDGVAVSGRSRREDETLAGGALGLLGGYGSDSGQEDCGK